MEKDDDRYVTGTVDDRFTTLLALPTLLQMAVEK